MDTRTYAICHTHPTHQEALCFKAQVTIRWGIGEPLYQELSPLLSSPGRRQGHIGHLAPTWLLPFQFLSIHLSPKSGPQEA